jgi:hypothetical protein
VIVFLLQGVAGPAGCLDPFFVAPLTKVFGGCSVTRQAHGCNRIASPAENLSEGAHLPGRGGETMYKETAGFSRDGWIKVKCFVSLMCYGIR